MNEIGFPPESDHSACKILISSQSITVLRLDQVMDVVAASRGTSVASSLIPRLKGSKQGESDVRRTGSSGGYGGW